MTAAEAEQEPNMPVGHLAALFNAQGPNVNCLTACAASSQAVGEATEMIRRGDVDIMLSGMKIAPYPRSSSSAAAAADAPRSGL